MESGRRDMGGMMKHKNQKLDVPGVGPDCPKGNYKIDIDRLILGDETPASVRHKRTIGGVCFKFFCIARPEVIKNYLEFEGLD